MIDSVNLSYAGQSATDPEIWLNLEQEPVSTNSLSLSDLETMMAMVSGGIPASMYTQPVCPAKVIDGEVIVPLGLWVWPSDLALDYALTVAIGDLSTPDRIEMEREFDLVINFSGSVDLPFYAAALSWSWSDMPCFDRYGAQITPPHLTVTPTAILGPSDFLGVIRVRCLAVGYRHTVTMRLPKSAVSSITDVSNSATVTWMDGAEQAETIIDLDLPRCAAQLLAACPDGQLQQERYFGAIHDDHDGRTVYYNACNGEVLAVRRER